MRPLALTSTLCVDSSDVGKGNEVYDMLVGHEVGHALYTPDRNWLEDVKIPPQIVNMVEDVRIEKLMKRRYLASPRRFIVDIKFLLMKTSLVLSDENVTK